MFGRVYRYPGFIWWPYRTYGSFGYHQYWVRYTLVRTLPYIPSSWFLSTYPITQVTVTNAFLENPNVVFHFKRYLASLPTAEREPGGPKSGKYLECLEEIRDFQHAPTLEHRRKRWAIIQRQAHSKSSQDQGCTLPVTVTNVLLKWVVGNSFLAVREIGEASPTRKHLYIS